MKNIFYTKELLIFCEILTSTVKIFFFFSFLKNQAVNASSYGKAVFFPFMIQIPCWCSSINLYVI